MKGTIAVTLTMMWGATAGASQAIAPAAHEGTGSFARRPAVEVEAVGGQKSLNHDQYRRLAVQSEAGVRVILSRRPDATFGLTADWLEGRSGRSGEGFAVTADTREVGLGVRARIEGRKVQAVAGVGVAYLRTSVVTAYSVNTRHIEESGFGVWYSLGLRVPMSSRVTVGAELRQTVAPRISREDARDGSAFHVGATLGVRFGSTGTRSGSRVAAWGQR